MTRRAPPTKIDRDWPSDGTESLGFCPVCGSEERNLLHSDLTDRIFFVAPGKWTMWRCLKCRSGYLDPRPTTASIGLAYGKYYTHEAPQASQRPSAIRQLRQAIGNDYRNAKYHARLMRALPFVGRLLVRLAPKTRARIDSEYRFLPPYRSGYRLLDVGCGNGQYLRFVRETGWAVTGVEPDPAAREIASSDGIEVRPSLGDWRNERASFHFVSASHVIEHVHDPNVFLREISRLLVESGKLYLQTPDIDAPTHYRFSSHWRGLEPPRHLVLFNRRSLQDALSAAGFRIERFEPCPEAAIFLIEQSERIAKGLDPYNGQRQTSAPLPAKPMPMTGAGPAKHEFITIIAVKNG